MSSAKQQTNYEKLRAVDCSHKVEKKNGLSYLSWAWAVDQLLLADETASWEYPTPIMYGETMMVFCSVTAFGKTRTAQLPVMDHRNKAIANPDAFAVNTAMQRCLVKAIALHGIGLYIYAGEDLPDGKKTPAEEVADAFLEALKAEEAGKTEEECEANKAARIGKLYAEKCADADFAIRVWDVLRPYPTERAAIKTYKDAYLKSGERKAA